MIINTSRAKSSACWRRAFNRYHRHLEGSRSMNLVDGQALHSAVAYGLATRDWNGSFERARAQFDTDKQAVTVLPEQSYLFDQHWGVVEKMVEIYRDNYASEEYQIIQPECEFDVQLPNTMHNCIWMHWLDRENEVDVWGPPPAEKILAGQVGSPHYIDDEKFKRPFVREALEKSYGREPQSCPCWQPHRLVGKTDALIKWGGNLWLLEHKTSSIQGEQYWAQWEIDPQPTAYIYGLWKQLGIRPRGFILDAVYKPSEAQVAAYNKNRKYGPAKQITDYMGYERRPYLRTEEDLAAIERMFISLCDEWEERIVQGRFQRTFNVSGSCLAYNRKCDYWGMCLTGDAQGEIDVLETTKPDYVTEKLVQILPKETPHAST